MALAGEINLTVSPAIIDELTDVLARKFDATAEEIAQAREIIAVAARAVRPSVTLDVIKEDPRTIESSNARSARVRTSS